jgi:hypothetical protein
MLRGIGSKPTGFAPHIPPLLFMAFQMMFAVITPALIAGAFVERMRFRGYLMFIASVVAPRVLPLRSLGVGRRVLGCRRFARRGLRRGIGGP